MDIVLFVDVDMYRLMVFRWHSVCVAATNEFNTWQLNVYHSTPLARRRFFFCASFLQLLTLAPSLFSHICFHAILFSFLPFGILLRPLASFALLCARV